MKKIFRILVAEDIGFYRTGRSSYPQLCLHDFGQTRICQRDRNGRYRKRTV